MSSPHHNERVDSVVESASGTAPARAVGEAARSALQSQRPTIGSGAVAPDTRARVKKGRRQGSGDYWSQRQKRSAARLSGMNVSASTAAAGGIVVGNAASLDDAPAHTSRPRSSRPRKAAPRLKQPTLPQAAAMGAFAPVTSDSSFAASAPDSQSVFNSLEPLPMVTAVDVIDNDSARIESSAATASASASATVTATNTSSKSASDSISNSNENTGPVGTTDANDDASARSESQQVNANPLANPTSSSGSAGPTSTTASTSSSGSAGPTSTTASTSDGITAPTSAALPSTPSLATFKAQCADQGKTSKRTKRRKPASKAKPAASSDTAPATSTPVASGVTAPVVPSEAVVPGTRESSTDAAKPAEGPGKVDAEKSGKTDADEKSGKADADEKSGKTDAVEKSAKADAAEKSAKAAAIKAERAALIVARAGRMEAPSLEGLIFGAIVVSADAPVPALVIRPMLICYQLFFHHAASQQPRLFPPPLPEEHEDVRLEMLRVLHNACVDPKSAPPNTELAARLRHLTDMCAESAKFSKGYVELDNIAYLSCMVAVLCGTIHDQHQNGGQEPLSSVDASEAGAIVLLCASSALLGPQGDEVGETCQYVADHWAACRPYIMSAVASALYILWLACDKEPPLSLNGPRPYSVLLRLLCMTLSKNLNTNAAMPGQPTDPGLQMAALIPIMTLERMFSNLPDSTLAETSVPSLLVIWASMAKLTDVPSMAMFLRIPGKLIEMIILRFEGAALSPGILRFVRDTLCGMIDAAAAFPIRRIVCPLLSVCATAVDGYFGERTTDTDELAKIRTEMAAAVWHQPSMRFLTRLAAGLSAELNEGGENKDYRAIISEVSKCSLVLLLCGPAADNKALERNPDSPEYVPTEDAEASFVLLNGFFAPMLAPPNSMAGMKRDLSNPINNSLTNEELALLCGGGSESVTTSRPRQQRVKAGGKIGGKKGKKARAKGGKGKAMTAADVNAAIASIEDRVEPTSAAQRSAASAILEARKHYEPHPHLIWMTMATQATGWLLTAWEDPYDAVCYDQQIAADAKAAGKQRSSPGVEAWLRSLWLQIMKLSAPDLGYMVKVGRVGFLEVILCSLPLLDVKSPWLDPAETSDNALMKIMTLLATHPQTLAAGKEAFIEPQPLVSFKPTATAAANRRLGDAVWRGMEAVMQAAIEDDKVGCLSSEQLLPILDMIAVVTSHVCRHPTESGPNAAMLTYLMWGVMTVAMQDQYDLTCQKVAEGLFAEMYYHSVEAEPRFQIGFKHFGTNIMTRLLARLRLPLMDEHDFQLRAIVCLLMVHVAHNMTLPMSTDMASKVANAVVKQAAVTGLGFHRFYLLSAISDLLKLFAPGSRFADAPLPHCARDSRLETVVRDTAMGAWLQCMSAGKATVADAKVVVDAEPPAIRTAADMMVGSRSELMAQIEQLNDSVLATRDSLPIAATTDAEHLGLDQVMRVGVCVNALEQSLQVIHDMASTHPTLREAFRKSESALCAFCHQAVSAMKLVHKYVHLTMAEGAPMETQLPPVMQPWVVAAAVPSGPVGSMVRLTNQIEAIMGTTEP